MEYSVFAHIMKPASDLSLLIPLYFILKCIFFPFTFQLVFRYLIHTADRSIWTVQEPDRAEQSTQNSYPWRLLKASRVYRQFRSWISGPRYTTLLSLSASWMLLCWSMWKTRCCDPSFALQFYNQIHAHPGRCGMLFTGRDTCMHNNDTHMAHTQSQTQCVFIIS
jgi:hypothetical protein